MSSSNGALKGTGAPCSIGSANIASRRLGNSDGNIAFNADPNVCVSRLAVTGGTRVCTILKEPRVEESLGEEGMYTRRGMCFKGVAGLRSIELILENEAKSSATPMSNACRNRNVARARPTVLYRIP
jgi:hypothetical protein